MSTSEHVLFLVGVLGLLVFIGIVFTFALPVPSHRYKAQSPTFARLFLLSIWLAFLAICFEPLGYPFFSAITLNIMVLFAMYMLLMTVLRRYGEVLQRWQVIAIAVHLLLCELVSWYFYGIDNRVLVREIILSVSVMVPLGAALYKIYRSIHKNNGGDELTFIIVSVAAVGVVLGVPAYLSTLEANEPVSEHVAFVALFTITILFMLGFPTSLMQSLFTRLSSQIYVDALTGTKNRHYFYKEAPNMLAHCRRQNMPFSMVACDVDHFKAVNDKYGHPSGDRALKQFTRTLQETVRQGDIVIRMGGEEFLILLPDSDMVQASTLAERLCSAVEYREIRLEKAVMKLTASFGVAMVNRNETIFDGIRHADEALYRAKASGRNQVKRAQA